MRLIRENDFYYATAQSFKDNIFGTHSKQILLAPQIQSDANAPELSLASAIRVPVYQKERVDMSNYIYEDSGIRNIKSVWVDFDLEKDNDNDGNPKNDQDTENIRILKSPNKIEIEFGAYDTLFKKKIGISLEDNNGNI
jgi:hypothetical protein